MSEQELGGVERDFNRGIIKRPGRALLDHDSMPTKSYDYIHSSST